MIIKNLEIVFDRLEGSNLIFKNNSGQEVIFDKASLKDVPQSGEKFYLSLDSKEVLGGAQDILNDILESKE